MPFMQTAQAGYWFLMHCSGPCHMACPLAAWGAELGALLGVEADKAEQIASRMAMENRLQVRPRLCLGEVGGICAAV